MNIRKIIKRTLLIVVLLVLIYIGRYASQALPILTGYGAKNLCSCTMVAGRNPEEIVKQELGGFPQRLGTYSVDYTDSSATGNVFGLFTRKAIFRRGLGCSLVVEIDEQAVRDQKVNVVVKAGLNADTIAWPTGNLMKDSLPDFNKEKLDNVLTSAFSEPGEKKLRRTRAMIVVYKGQIIAERYADGFDANTKLTGWSMSKSVTNSLIGVLVKQGKLKTDAPAPIQAWQEDERRKITLSDLMHQSSGLDWTEVYSGPSSATNMLFKKKDMGLFAAESSLQDVPGERFYYSSGTSNILARIVRNTVGDEDYYRFPYGEVLYKIGMFNTILEPDAGGTFVGSSYTFGTARDWARFGLLYLYDGVWNGERILPEGWVTYTTTPAKGAQLGEYGAQFWLNAGAPGNPEKRYYPSAPTDLYWADGFEGQNVFIIPSKDLVIVKLSLSSGDYLNDDEFLGGVISAVNP